MCLSGVRRRVSRFTRERGKRLRVAPVRRLRGWSISSGPAPAGLWSVFRASTTPVWQRRPGDDFCGCHYFALYVVAGHVSSSSSRIPARAVGPLEWRGVKRCIPGTELVGTGSEQSPPPLAVMLRVLPIIAFLSAASSCANGDDDAPAESPCGPVARAVAADEAHLAAPGWRHADRAAAQIRVHRKSGGAAAAHGWTHAHFR